MKEKRHLKKFICNFFLLCYLITQGAIAQTFDHIKNEVKEHNLKNGMKFIVLERHQAPVVCFHVFLGAGAPKYNYFFKKNSYFY